MRKGWIRLGIIASVVWALAAGYHTRNEDLERAGSQYSLSYKLCSEERFARTGSIEGCSEEAHQDYQIWLKGSWVNTAIGAFAPIPFGWAFAYLVFWVFSWVRQGFRGDGATN